MADRLARLAAESVEMKPEITPEMIEAGAREVTLYDHDFETAEDAAVRIFVAMLSSRSQEY